MDRQENLITNSLIIPFIKAWNLFFEIPIPIENFSKNIILNEEYDSRVLYFVPIIGLVLGLFAYVISWIIYQIGGEVIAAILCPFIIIIVWEFLNRGKDTENLSSLICSKFFNESEEISVDYSAHTNRSMYFYVFIGVFVLRILCLGTLIYLQRFGWLVVIAVLTHSIQGYLAIDRENLSSEKIFISADPSAAVIMWIVASVLCSIFSFTYFPMLIVSLVITIFIAYRLKNYLENKGILSGTNIGISGKLIEIIVLILGLLSRFIF